jgi:type IX secretion system PorP/SprF family membrane protein
MVRLRIILISFFFQTCSMVSGQLYDSSLISTGYPVYSQYLQNGLIVNPAYTGTRGVLSAFLSYRMQWMGTTGAPVIQSFSLHTPMKNDRVALGLMGQFMQYGYTKSESIYASYAYHIKLGYGKISFGLKGGFDRSKTDYSGILLNTPGDPVFSGTDRAYFLPNVGAGIYYFSNDLFAGMAVPTFLSYRKTGSGSVEAFHSFGNYDFVLTSGALITVSEFLKLKPSVLVDYSLQKTKRISQLDISCNFILGDLFWLGGSWRTNEKAAVGILQVQASPQLMFGFSYDYPAGKMNSFSSGSGEFILRYEFDYRVSAANPRYF